MDNSIILYGSAASEIGATNESKIRQATCILIMRPFAAALLDEHVGSFVHAGRLLDRPASEIILNHFDDPNTPNAHRQAMVAGCLDCINAFRQKIENRELFDFSERSVNSNFIHMGDLELTIAHMARSAANLQSPELVAPVISPNAHTLLNTCFEYGASIDVKAIACGIASSVDSYLLWDDCQKTYWRSLLEKPDIPHHALSHIWSRDPNDPSVDKAVVDILMKALEGRENVDVPVFLDRFRRVRDQAAVESALEKIPEALHPKLRAVLESRPFSRPLVKLIPLSGARP